MNIDWEKIVPTLAGGLMALTGSFGAIFVQNWRQNRTLRNATENIVKSEMKAILHLIERNKYIESLEAAVQSTSHNRLEIFTFSAERSFTKVYETHLNNLGLLKDASKILSFYMLINSALEDKDVIDRFFRRANEKYPEGVPTGTYDWRELATDYKTLLGKLKDIKRIGHEVVG